MTPAIATHKGAEDPPVAPAWPWAALPDYRADYRRRNPVPDPSSVLSELADRPQWLVWGYRLGETEEKKYRKMPHYADGGRRFSDQGSDKDRKRLVTLVDAVAAVSRGDFDGVGFAFLPDDGLIGIDLDGMIDPETGEISERCEAIIDACDSYTELSPSGKGVHIFCAQEHAEGLRTFKSNKVGVEVFIGAQFFTFTGRVWPGASLAINPMPPRTLARLRATVEAGKVKPAAASECPAAPTNIPASPDGFQRSLAQTVALAEEALAFIDPSDYEEWIAIGQACRASLGTSGYALWDAWSSRAPNYAGAADTEKRWKTFKGEMTSVGAIFKKAEAAGWESPWSKAKKRKATRPGAEDPPAGREASKQANMSNVTSLEKAAEKLAEKKNPKPTSAPPGELFTADGKRIIQHKNGHLPTVLDLVERSLSESPELHLFRYASRLARVYQAEEPKDKSVKRPAGAIMVHPVESAHMAELAGRAANHQKWDSRLSEYVATDCPRRVADSLLARGHWPRLPDLVGFIETPTITDDGRVIDQPGYDDSSGLFCAFTAISGYKRPPDKPTLNDASAAAERLLKLFDSFPFVDATDRVAMLAALLTAIQRRLLPAAPLMAITAPTPGTGKTLLCETLALVATARRASVLSLGHDDAESEKRLAGVLLAGDAVISVDNIERPLKGDLLCQVATQQFVRLRPLGGSGMLNVPTHSLIVATGNNLAIIGDLKRRVLMIRLDAKTERPEHRAFDRDHLATITAQRGEIISLSLTIIAAYLAAGAPKIAGLHGFGGFEQWDRMVRRPLVWLDLPDPLLTSEELREQDPDLEAMRLLYSAWQTSFGERPVTVAEVITEGASVGQSANEELRDALQLVCAEKPNSRRLSYWMRSHRERIIDGLQLCKAGADGHAKVAKWKVIKCG